MSDSSNDSPVLGAREASPDHHVMTLDATPDAITAGRAGAQATLAGTLPDGHNCEVGHLSPAVPIRDETYYFHDGSCVFLVEGCLFNIHRSIFERNSQFFQTMWSLPQSQEGSTGKGSCDADPVVCYDSAEDFRSLCWALYASPADIMEQKIIDNVNIPGLIRVISLAHKYEFADLRGWALDVLDAHLLINSGKVLDLCGGWENVDRALRFSCLCDRADLQLRIEQAWICRISTSPKDLQSLELALDAAERYNLRRFHGEVYYAYLKAIGKFCKRTTIDQTALSISRIASYVDSEPLPSLNAVRKLRLYHGFWSLVQLRHQLDFPPELDQNTQCSAHQKCISFWEHCWRDILHEESHLNDPGEVFHNIQMSVRLYYCSYSYRDAPCGPQIRNWAHLMKQQFQESLPQHFMIP